METGDRERKCFERRRHTFPGIYHYVCQEQVLGYTGHSGGWKAYAHFASKAHHPAAHENCAKKKDPGVHLTTRWQGLLEKLGLRSCRRSAPSQGTGNCAVAFEMSRMLPGGSWPEATQRGAGPRLRELSMPGAQWPTLPAGQACNSGWKGSGGRNLGGQTAPEVKGPAQSQRET